jgi:hypothetical protein
MSGMRGAYRNTVYKKTCHLYSGMIARAESLKFERVRCMFGRPGLGLGLGLGLGRVVVFAQFGDLHKQTRDAWAVEEI